MKNQLYFEFYHPTSFEQEDFILSTANIDTFKSIKNYTSWPNKRLLILGDEGAGKTHLSMIWQQQADAIMVSPQLDLAEIPFANMVIDNLEVFDEELLFHLINHAYQNQLYLLMTAERLPSFKIADLQSRINATSKTVIHVPDDELIKVILIKQLTDRQLKFDHEVINYLLPRIERDFTKLKKVVELISNAISHNKARLTTRLLNKVLMGLQ